MIPWIVGLVYLIKYIGEKTRKDKVFEKNVNLIEQKLHKNSEDGYEFIQNPIHL